MSDEDDIAGHRKAAGEYRTHAAALTGAQLSGVLHAAANRIDSACDGWRRALTTAAEERQAWDRYAAASISRGLDCIEDASGCADQMLAERRKRFGGAP